MLEEPHETAALIIEFARNPTAEHAMVEPGIGTPWWELASGGEESG
jgi:hypothetical protein